MFFDEAALAALFAHFHGYLHAELADAATTIVHAMATSTVQPTLTTRGMYPFLDNYMYFVPYERVGRRTLARVAAEMDDGCTEESTLDNGETVVVLTGISEVTGVEPLLRAVLGQGAYDLEWIERVGGTRSPVDTPLWRVLERWLGSIEPEARLAPVVCAP